MAIKYRLRVFKKPFHWREERYEKYLKENDLFRSREELEMSLKSRGTN